MASYNRVILLGNCTRDIELKYTPSGTAVCDIGLAVNEKRKNASGEWVDECVYVDVAAFGRTAEVAAEYLAKGSPVFIEGKLKLDQWTDKKTGDKRSRLRVFCERLQLIGSKGGSGQGGGRQYYDEQHSHRDGSVEHSQPQDEASSRDGDEIPF